MRFLFPLIAAALIVVPGCGPKQDANSEVVAPPVVAGPTAGAPKAEPNKAGGLLPPGR